jgi:hypothetical protein
MDLDLSGDSLKMATITKKSREQSPAIPQLSTLPERVSVLEVHVGNINEKIDDVKADICANHETIINTLKTMRDESTTQHNELAGKVKDLEGFKNKWIKYGIAALAFLAGAGWIGHPGMADIFKFLGL